MTASSIIRTIIFILFWFYDNGMIEGMAKNPSRTSFIFSIFTILWKSPERKYRETLAVTVTNCVTEKCVEWDFRTSRFNLENLDSMHMPPLHSPLNTIKKIRIKHGSAIHRSANKLKMISWKKNFFKLNLAPYSTDVIQFLDNIWT